MNYDDFFMHTIHYNVSMYPGGVVLNTQFVVIHHSILVIKYQTTKFVMYMCTEHTQC